MYVNCDGAMDYDNTSPGGVGFLISFPEKADLEPIEFSRGIYVGGNIERLELEALIQAMKKTIEVCEDHHDKLWCVNQVIFITDRYGLREDGKTSPYKILGWRKNKWKNFEGKAIKNHKLLDELDKTRTKLSRVAGARVNIEWRRRKENKAADKLAKAGKYHGVSNYKLEKKGEKIGKRKFKGKEVDYKDLKVEETYRINIFRKDPVQDQWEVWGEICDPNDLQGFKFKIYTDDILASRLKRGNEFKIKIKEIYRFHVTIYKSVYNYKSK